MAGRTAVSTDVAKMEAIVSPFSSPIESSANEACPGSPVALILQQLSYNLAAGWKNCFFMNAR